MERMSGMISEHIKMFYGTGGWYRVLSRILIVLSMPSIGLIESLNRCLNFFPQELEPEERWKATAKLHSGILKLLMKLRDERGLSILFITHDMGLAHYVSNRLLVMYEGRIVVEGTPNEIIESPKHPYTKRLISDIPLLYRKWSDI